VHLVDELRDVVGAAHVLVDADAVAGHVTDWTGGFVGHTPAVVRPASTAEVAGVLAVCRRAGAPVVPQGGNTGLVAGGVPLQGEVVLSVRRLDGVSPVDQLAGQITAGAGATLAAVQAAAVAAGWRYAVDLSARDSATIGGTVATNAGGLHVIRHGHTRAQLVGVEAVLADGSIVRHLGGLVKDNSGYDLAGLVCGSEGTLAVVTAARLRLVAPTNDPRTALVAFGSLADAAAAVGALRREIAEIEVLELMTRGGVELTTDRLGVRRPFPLPHDAYLLVETERRVALDAIVAGLPGLADAAVATDGPSRRALWELRDRHTEAIALVGVPLKLDVAVPLDALAAFLDAVPGTVERAAPGAAVWCFGHAGDGNVHVNVTGHGDRGEEVAGAVLRLVAERGGSISAEHGIGTMKRRWLHLTRSPEEIRAMRAIKRALDPDGILNPNVLLP
jgi:FAD/FMN-containing dehydrogenase